jgi:uncharacterized protein (TIGR03437 family)
MAGHNPAVESGIFMRFSLLAAFAAALFPGALISQTVSGPKVRFETNLGNIDVNLLSHAAPRTVANFLNYVNNGAYTNSVFHRSVANFIIQGGGFRPDGSEIQQDPPVRNEFNVSNTRGTIAMAKLDAQPNSATNQWFFNLSDNNARNLNNQNGGFTVFGRVADDDSLAVMDRIAAVPVPNPAVLPAPFDAMPLIDFRGGQPTEANMVVVKSITVLDPLPAPVISGIISASSFGGLTTATAGSYIEIYGSNLAGTTRSWDTSDFAGDRAPTSLDGVIVTINGQPGYVSFVSPGQINVQVPASAPSNRVVSVGLLYRGQNSQPVDLSLKAQAAGLLAPPSFNVNGKQYVAAQKGSAFVGNGSISNVPAAPGDTLVLYGTGFGAVTPVSFPIAGQIARGGTNVTTPVQIHIGDLQAQILYAGHVPSLVGLYQFNLNVPGDAPTGDLPVRVTIGGETVPQTLFLTVRRPN